MIIRTMQISPERSQLRKALLSFLTIFALALPLRAASTTFYVSPSGNDSWSGTLSAVNSAKTDGPVATIQHALTLARQARSANPFVDVSILLRGGKYSLNETLTIGSDDSGTADSPLIIENFPGESPVVSGSGNSIALNFNNASHVLVSGITLQDGLWNVFRTNSGSDIEISACTIKNAGSWAGVISGTPGALLTANIVENTGTAFTTGSYSGGRGFLICNKSPGTVIEANRFINLKDAVSVASGESGITVIRNLFDADGTTLSNLEAVSSTNSVSYNYLLNTDGSITATASTSPDGITLDWNSLLSASADSIYSTLQSGSTASLTETAPPPNQTPIVNNPIPAKSAQAGSSFSYTVPASTFSDPDGDALTWSASGSPSWLSFVSTTHTFTGTVPSTAASGTLSIPVSASDPSGASTSTSMALSITVPVSTGIWPSGLNTGLDAYYKLEKNLHDDTGRHNGSWSGSTLAVGGGKLGFGYHWTGDVNSRIKTGITTLLPTTGRSFSLWMYPENLQTGRAFLGWTSGFLNSMQFGIARGSRSLQLEISTGNGANKIDFPLRDYEQWYHVVVNIPAGSSSTADIQIWVDGVKETGTQIAGSPTPLSSLGAGQWEIGQAYTGGSAWVGWIDEVGTWTRTLTASEIAQLYNNGKGITRGTITPDFTWKHEDFARSWHYDTVKNRALILQRLKELQQLHINGVPDFSTLYFAASSPKTIYVSAGHGNDYSGNGSSSSPYRTLRYVLQNVIPDTLTTPTIIYLDDSGEYTGAPYNLQYTCTATNWLAIRKNPASATRPVIKYDPQWIASELRYDETQGAQDYQFLPGKAYEPIFRLDGANQGKSNYIEISGLHIIGARKELPNNLSTECGIMTNNTGGHHCRFLDNEIEQTGHVAIKGYTVNAGDWVADGNYIHDVGHDGHDHCLYAWGPDITIRRNILMNPVGNYVSLRTVNSHGGKILFNLCWGSGQQGFVIGGRDMTVAHNILVNTAGENAQVFYMARGSCANNVVANNVVIQIDSATATNLLLWDTLGWKGSDPTGNTVETNYVQGNLIINQPNQISHTWAADTSFPKDRIVEDNNGIYYQNGNDPATSGSTAPSGTGTAIRDGNCVWVYVNSVSNAANTLSGNTLIWTLTGSVAVADSNFTDIENLDFHPTSTSQCIGTGKDIGYGTDIGIW